jgi:thymidine kinase
MSPEFPSHAQRRGWVEVIAGSMSAGKSSELQRRIRRAEIARRAVQVFKHAIDDRGAAYGGTTAICSHDGVCIQATPVARASEIMDAVLEDTEVVAIDEVQFFGDDLVDVVNTLADSGKRVIVAGLSTDFRGAPFGPMGALLCISESVLKLSAICNQCGHEAIRTQRLANGRPVPADAPVVQVGGLDAYEARCRDCHEVPPGAAAEAA